MSDDRIHLFEDFTLDLTRGFLLRGDELVHLRPQTYAVLKCLVENRGRLISKNKLIEDVWQGRAVTDGSLGKCIEELREALGENALEYLRNVRGRGYILDTGIEEPKESEALWTRSEQIDVVRVTVHEEETDAELIGPDRLPAPISASRWRLHARTTLLTTAALLVIGAATAFGIYWLISQRQTRAPAVAVPFHDMDISQFTTSGKTTHAAISPDGKYIAHVTVDANGNSLWVRHVAAPSNVRIAGPAMTEYISVAFAPDGNSVYYIALDHDKGESTLYRVPVLGGQSNILAHDIYPVGFSPDGQQIAFIRMRRAESHLVVADLDGANQRVVAIRYKPDFFEMEWNAPAWSPDRKTIACPIMLNDPHGHYETIISVSATDGTQAPLTSARWNYVGQAVWLADGSGLLVSASERPGAPMQVWHVSLQGGVATRITHDLNNYHDLSLTGDARRLAAVQVQAVSNIWVAPEADARGARQISSEIGSLEVLAWTPEGQIVYRSSAGGEGADIWIMKADGSNAKQLTVGARASQGMAVTPDGRHIIFVSDRAGQFNLWRVDTDGGNLRQLTAGDGEFYPQCTPDGQWVVFQGGYIDPRLWKVPTEGGEAVQLTKTRATRPAVSPDGQIIAYSYLDVELDPWRWGIGIVSSEGGQRLKRFDFPPTVIYRPVRWSRDGQSIAFLNSSSGGLSDIWLQPLDGSPPRQLTSFKGQQIIAFDWSPDGRSLAFVCDVETRDVVLIEQRQK